MRLSVTYLYIPGKISFNKRRVRKLLEISGSIVEEEESVRFGEIGVAVMSDAKLRKINSELLGHDHDTDIITVDLTDKELPEGELMISAETVAFNSRKYGVDFETEITRVFVHGLLHLLGYDDKTADGKRTMRKLESKAIKKVKNAGKNN